MVGRLLSLKGALFRASFRRSGWVVAGTVVSLVIAGCAVLAAAAGFLALREAGPLVAAAGIDSASSSVLRRACAGAGTSTSPVTDIGVCCSSSTSQTTASARK